MSCMERNHSDLPLTSGETSDFLPAESDTAAATESVTATGVFTVGSDRRRSSGKRDKSGGGNLARDRLGSGISGITIQVREQWGSKFEFIFSCMAFSVGLGNVWRFPYLCYKNGGGAFLIPYALCLIGGGIPCYFLEVAIGQYFQAGGITVWQYVCPLFRGIGFGTTIINFIMNCYYIVILAWAVLFLRYSFNWTLPWSTCNNEWNSMSCWSSKEGYPVHNTSEHPVVDSVVEFWERKILQISPGIDQPNGLQWELVASLAIAWIACFFCIWRGIRSTGKSAYFTAIFPYLMLVCLFVRGVTLPGASQGIAFYLKPDFNRLLDNQVWIDAGTQIFFSYAIAVGTMTALGSYNDFHNNFYHQLGFVCLMNSGTSFFAGFAIFSVIGFMAAEQGVPVGSVVEGGPGLAFIAYPKGVAQMPGSTIWAILFFLMILSLGLGSQFVAVEGFVTAVVDIFPKFLRKGNRRVYFVASTCILSFCIGLSMVTRGGMYVFQLFDYYGASGMCLLWMCMFEAGVLGWIYGAEKFEKNITSMLRSPILPYFRYAWKYATPLVTLAILISTLITHTPIKYNSVYEYPAWGIGLGWFLALVSMTAVPAYALYAVATTPGSLRQRLVKLTTATVPNHVLVMQRNGSNGKPFPDIVVVDN